MIETIVEIVPEPPREAKKYAIRPIEMTDAISPVQSRMPSIALWRGPYWPGGRRGKRRQRKEVNQKPFLNLLQEEGPGRARIAGTRIKVSLVAEQHTRLGMTAEQIAGAYPHLSLAQVHAALAYYYSHQEAVDAQIAAALDFADQSRQEAEPSPFAARLRMEGRLPAERAA